MSDTGSAEQAEVQFRLSQARTARAFTGRASIWHDELGQIMTLIEAHQGDLRKQADDDDRQKSKPILSIAIFGTYGSGKSSLLRSLVKKFNKQEVKGIHALPVIEPSQVAAGDHFLYHFLAAALEEDARINDRSEEQGLSSRALTSIQQQFQHLSEYLQVLDQQGDPVENDALGRSLACLDRHSSVLLLKKGLAKLIITLAEILAGSSSDSVILLPVDDADLSSETLLATLNCLSRYLVHPRLIPVFTLTGALAEELLCKEFERRLQIAPVKGGASKIRPVFLSVTENLALQSLSKFFPPRNRIKLGNTVQRIRDGEYIPADEETNSGHSDSNGKKPGKAVQDLLSAANLILFGQSKHLLGPDTRRILYTTHLRRQIQIIDVLHEAGVMKFFEEEEDERPDWRRLDCKRPAWFRVFREATWSLLNVHRDILREFDLNFESLYGWANKENLRVLLLDSLGKVDYAQLRPLLRAWFYSHEDRRPELFSLLAACVFSPRRFGGETPEGREFHQIEKEALQAYEEKYSIAPGMATLWTLELWLGFYLPLMIRHQRSYVPKQSAEMHFSRLGWNLVMGAGNAVKEAMTDQVSFFPGMLPLSPSCLPPAKESMDHKSMLLLRLWCFNGFNAGFPWLTASLWRGLSLVGRLIELDFHLTTLERKAKQRNDRKKDDEKIPNETLDEAITIRRKALIETILIEHLNIGSQTYAPPYFEVSQVNKAIDPEHHEAYFSDWSKLSLPNSDEDKDEQFELLDGLAQDLMKWLKTYNNPQKRIYLCGDNEKTGPTIPVLPEDEVDELLSKTSRSEEEVRRKILEFRNNCFIQRIHGNSLLGKLWSDLEDAFLEMGPDSMNIAAALGKWLSVFCDYWSRPDGKDEHESGLSTVRDLVEQCPFVFPLIEYDRNTAKPPEPGEDGENPKSPDSPKDIKQSRELNKPNFFSDGNVLETLRKVTGLPPYPYIKEEKKIEQTLTWREKEQEIGGTEQENGETPGEGEGGNK